MQFATQIEGLIAKGKDTFFFWIWQVRLEETRNPHQHCDRSAAFSQRGSPVSHMSREWHGTMSPHCLWQNTPPFWERRWSQTGTLVASPNWLRRRQKVGRSLSCFISHLPLWFISCRFWEYAYLFRLNRHPQSLDTVAHGLSVHNQLGSLHAGIGRVLGKLLKHQCVGREVVVWQVKTCQNPGTLVEAQVI